MMRYFVVDTAGIRKGQSVVTIDKLGIFVWLTKMIEKTFAIGPVRHWVLPAINVDDATGGEQSAIGRRAVSKGKERLR